MNEKHAPAAETAPLPPPPFAEPAGAAAVTFQQPAQQAPMVIANAKNLPVDANGEREWNEGLCARFGSGTCLLGVGLGFHV